MYGQPGGVTLKYGWGAEQQRDAFWRAGPPLAAVTLLVISEVKNGEHS